MRVIQDRSGAYLLVEDGQIQATTLCESYDSYGNRIGCEAAGCYEGIHIKAKAIIYWDGHWRSYILEVEGSNEHDGVLLDEDDPIATQILREFGEAVFPAEAKLGIKTAETEHYKFYVSLWEGTFEIATAIKL